MAKLVFCMEIGGRNETESDSDRIRFATLLMAESVLIACQYRGFAKIGNAIFIGKGTVVFDFDKR